MPTSLRGEDRLVLKLRPGITGPATLKYRDEEDMIAGWIAANRGRDGMNDAQLAVWYNDHVIYPDKVRLNLYYYKHYSFFQDIKMIFATVLGRKIQYAGEQI